MRRAELVRAFVLAFAALLVACAAPAPRSRPPFADPLLSVDRAAAALSPGSTTKAQARALLGEPETVPFDSGYEAWVYRRQGEGAPREELVLLFEPAGTLARMRAITGPPR
jgi:outer membrane protein assembly factor BamE (lipoprotein component of BamABCDE complex)